ncbi:MAG TPA: purine-nucleoside phosphorylase [Thermoanaerobaculia bacterium]|jgi:purine-nucleoside phosphorylase|nr:purine-nucleoside phosphorylase [Thermoanaerobaculia bacterium]
MQHWQEELRAAAAAWRGGGWPAPKVALISGSGLAVDLDLPSTGRQPLQRFIPWPVHAIVGHPLELEVLLPEGPAPIAYFRGRLHSYQGYTAAQTVFPVRLAALLGARVLLLTNAAGTVSDRVPPGGFALVTDHLNLTGLNPLRGTPPEEWGPRFPDMVDAYDPRLRALLHRHAAAIGLQLAEGVYGGLAGPTYETPAEVRMMRTLGADLVGMSTVLEVIAARHMGVRCACLSLAANYGAGMVSEPLVHEDVLAAGQAAAAHLRRLFERVLVDPALTV